MIPRLAKLLAKKAEREKREKLKETASKAAASFKPTSVEPPRASESGDRSPPRDANPTVARLWEKAQHKKGHSGSLHEVDRICLLPTWEWPTEEEVEEFNKRHVLASAYNAGFRFRVEQVASFLAYQQTGGGFLPLGVGLGKTAICLYTASLAYDKGIKKILLLVPPEVYHQLLAVDLPWARKRFTLGYPVTALHGLTQARRKLAVDRKQRGLFVMPYSYLSVKDTDYMLDKINPGLIIADEVHLLKNIDKSARAKRVMKFLDERGCEFVCMSGTITDKGLKDYAHLIVRALKEGSPLPMQASVRRDWALVIDSNASAGAEVSTGPIMPLVFWARREFPDEKFAASRAGLRKAYKNRLVTTPGVVSSGDSGVKCSLMVSNIPVTNEWSDLPQYEGGQELYDLAMAVEEDWLTPSGDEIEHAIHKFKWLKELTAGFYNKLYWASPAVWAKRRNVSEDQAKELLDGAMTHHEARQDYAKALRAFFKEVHVSGLDTPLLVGGFFGNVRAGKSTLPKGMEGLYDLWIKVKDLEFEGMPQRDSAVVRVCPYKIDACIEWVKSLPKKQFKKGGIVWVLNKGIGVWAVERFRAAGIEVMPCPAGNPYNKRILESHGQWVIASLRGHGTGKNLQFHENQYFLQWPRGAVRAEQTLGRMHRQGQQADALNSILAGSRLTFVARFLTFHALPRSRYRASGLKRCAENECLQSFSQFSVSTTPYRGGSR